MSKTKTRQADYTFKQACDVCDQRPILKDTGMCSTCTFGERGSMWEWLDDGVAKTERKLAERYVFEKIFLPMGEELFDKHGDMNPIMAALLHIDQPVLDKIERLL